MIAVIKAASPIAHGGFGPDAGNAQAARRMSVVSIDGHPLIPCISGSALRGVIRRALMRELFERSGIDRETLPDKQWDRLYAALANGGHLTGPLKQSINPDNVRALREALPPLSVLGAALYDRFLPGRVSVGIAWLRCKETAMGGVVSDSGKFTSIAGEELIEEIGMARHIDRETQDPSITGVTPMPLIVEAVSAGAEFESTMVFDRSATPMEKAAISHGLRCVRILGGHSAAGFGRVDIEVDAPDAAYKEWLDGGGYVDALRALAKEFACRS